MNALHMRACVAVATLACGTVAVLAQSAPAAAPGNGCPPHYDLVQVSVIAVDGYQVPGMVDDPTSGIRSFGKLGNHDDWVCALPLGNQTTPWAGQVYNFVDNSLLT